MKHILNDLTEQEKNAIREQHTGGMNVVTENFSRLLNSKLGDVKLINEQYKGIMKDVSNIPCIKKDFIFSLYKISDRQVLSKFQGLGGVKPVLSKDNYFILDTTNASYSENKWGTASIFSNGKNVGTFNLDGTSLGDELTSVMEKAYVSQNNNNKFKIGWVLCNGELYIYDMLGEEKEKNAIR